MVDETGLAIRKMQGSRGITIVSLKRKFKLHIPLNPYWLKWQTQRLKLAAKDFETSQFHQDSCNRYLMSLFVSVHTPGNGISYSELRRWYKALHSELVQPSATTLSNICRWEYALTVYVIKNQLPSQNNVSLAFDGWTSTNKLAIWSVIAHYMDRNWALHEVQVACDVVDRLLFSRFES